MDTPKLRAKKETKGAQNESTKDSPQNASPRPNTNQESRSGIGPAGTILFLALFFVFYVLSIGPAVWLHNSVDNTSIQRGLEFFYTPLEYVVHGPLEGTWAGDAIDAYVAIWDKP